MSEELETFLKFSFSSIATRLANLSIHIDIIGKKSCIVCVDNNISCRYVLSIKFLTKINRISVNFSSNCCSIILVLSPHQKVDSNNMQKCIIACFPSVGIWPPLKKWRSDASRADIFHYNSGNTKAESTCSNAILQKTDYGFLKKTNKEIEH